MKAFVTDAVINGYRNAAAFIKATLRKIKEYSEEITTCENLLNPDVRLFLLSLLFQFDNADHIHILSLAFAFYHLLVSHLLFP